MYVCVHLRVIASACVSAWLQGTYAGQVDPQVRALLSVDPRGSSDPTRYVLVSALFIYMHAQARMHTRVMWHARMSLHLPTHT
jgi:hypothetical protein